MTYIGMVVGEFRGRTALRPGRGQVRIVESDGAVLVATLSNRTAFQRGEATLAAGNYLM